ncbi:MAG: hypothetical protein AB7S41_19405 [Parvibaculaceae bacterium]
MLKKTALGAAVAAAIGAIGLFGGAPTAQAGINFNIIVPGFYVGPPRYYYGGYWAPGYYAGGVYRPRYYHYRTGHYKCRRWLDHRGRKKHKCWR